MMTVFGADLFFPFNLNIDESEQLYRYQTTRFAARLLVGFCSFPTLSFCI